jgi:hypothetical protein
MTITRIVLTLALLMAGVASYAGAPTCAVSGTTNYCQYTGLVNQAYVNASNQVILYFDTFMTAAQAATLSATEVHACSVDLGTTQSAQFGKMFYATLLTAQATRRSVTVMMVGAVFGYPRCDRIWLAQ